MPIRNVGSDTPIKDTAMKIFDSNEFCRRAV